MTTDDLTNVTKAPGKRVIPPCPKDPKGLGWHHPTYQDGVTYCKRCRVQLWST